MRRSVFATYTEPTEMESILRVITALYMLIYSCQGLDVALTLAQETATVAGLRHACGVLTCEEVITSSDPSRPDTDQAGSSVGMDSIASLSVFRRLRTGSSSEPPARRAVLLGSVTSQAPSLTRVANGRTIEGRLEAGRASLRVELVKQEDCGAEFVCQVRGLDSQGREVVNSASVVQPAGQRGSPGSASSLAPGMSLQLLTSLQQLIAQSVDRLEDKIEQMKSEADEKSDSFQRRLDDKLNLFENRVEDKIDNNNNLNKLIQLDSKVSTQLAQFRAEAKSELLDTLETTRQRLQAEQKDALKNVSQFFEATLGNASDLLSSMESHLDSAKTYGQMNWRTVRNETETIQEMLTSGTISARCLQNNSESENKDSVSPVTVAKRVTCERNMAAGENKTSPTYIMTTQPIIRREILCDTQTDGGGWIVIQRRTKGDVFFNRDWDSYKNGFGTLDSDGDFWLGNEAVHLLTYVQPYELRVEFRSGGEDFFAGYKTFNLDSEANKYRIQVGGAHGSIDNGCGDVGLSYSNGMSFSTFDKDNDAHSTVHCAKRYKAGWWYKTCYDAMLNAPAPWKDLNNKWYNSKHKWMPITSTAMKIRPLKVN